MGRHQVAIADYDTALRLRPRFVNAFVARADAYLAKGETANAIADFRRAVALDRNVIVNHPGIAEKLSRLGDMP
jgi:tetratricopeptide (TPR) repeat protein